MELSLPPFTPAVTWLLGINVGMFFVIELLSIAKMGGPLHYIAYAALVPSNVLHGHIYELVTYSFLHAGGMHLFGNMLGLWMFGSQIETDFGTRRFLSFYFWCVIGAALTTIAVSYTGVLGVSPDMPTIGASGGVYGILIAFGVVHAEQEIMMLPFPFRVKAKYFVGILVVITLALALSEGNGGSGASIAYAAHLGGLIFGFIYVKAFSRRGFKFLFSERYYGVRNSYYRWKRKRAAKKFEVYMRQHKREDYFDDYGNFKDPNSGKDDKGNGPWVN